MAPEKKQTWRNITDLRAIAKKAGITRPNIKDEKELLEALVKLDVNVAESASKGKAKTPIQKLQLDKTQAKKEETKKASVEPKTGGAIEGLTTVLEDFDLEEEETDSPASGQSVNKLTRRVEELESLLADARNDLSLAIKREAVENKPRPYNELLAEQREQARLEKAAAPFGLTPVEQAQLKFLAGRESIARQNNAAMMVAKQKLKQ